MIRLAIGLAFIVFVASPAYAKHHRHNVIHNYSQFYLADDERIVSHPYGCPRIAFCGCGVSVKVFGRPVRDLFLASNWYKFPRANPGPGMVAVRNHHVMYIESYDGNGNATVYDPNSGHHKTREHIRSLAGYKIVNPNGIKPSYAYNTWPAY